MRGGVSTVDAAAGHVDHDVGAGPEDIVKVTNYVLDRANLPLLVEARRAILGDLRPASTAVVAGLAREELLVEVDAIVALPTV